MRTLEFTFRKSYKNEAGEKINYGNSTEKVESGPNKGDDVTCFRIKFDRLPETSEEFIQDIGGQPKFIKAMETIYEQALKEHFKSAVFLKLEKDAERDPAVRADVITKIERAAKEFSYATAISEALNAKTAVDELNSPEMQELSRTDPAEFTRRVMAVLAQTRGTGKAA